MLSYNQLQTKEMEMKSIEYREYSDLYALEQEAAVNHFMQEALQFACEMPEWYRLEHHDNDLYNKILKAHKKADKNQTPWFLGEFVMESCGDKLRAIALTNAESALYEPLMVGHTLVTSYELVMAGKNE